jgi:hypothetical protein
MSVTNISAANRYILWGKSGGRCEYRGCNKPLFRDALTQGEFNQAYIAHIIADVPGGPRGDAIKSDLLKDDLTNLMLMCDEHHRLVDKVAVVFHTVELLLEMKKEHEERIEIVSSINPNMHSHIITYRANVGEHAPVITYESSREFLLPTHYPAMASSIDLSLSNSPQRDRDESFWKTELENLESQFNDQLRPKLRKNEINHLSIFAFAPMPLLIKLGTLINDIQHAEIHQPVRTPKTWNLSNELEPIKYKVEEPEKTFTTVALNISLSATINNDRITRVLGDECSIYTITTDNPFNDFLKAKNQLAEFSLEIRQLLNKIKSRYNAQTPLNIFPAMPIAASIELGRIWMPKADMPLNIYDENTNNGGFFKAIEIRNDK